MGSCTREQREFLKLFKCVLDTGNEVLSAFFDLKVLSLPHYGGNFNQFLEIEKHFLYHQWEPKKTTCCACPKFGCSIKRIRKMETWIFQKLYEANGKEDPAHVIKHGGCIQQLCLHKFVTKNIAAHELDISVLSFLLRIFASMSVSENVSLDTVSLCRSSICHAWSTKCFPMAELNKMWNDLETHLISLSEVRYRRIVQKQIQAFRKLEIDREEIAELSNHINYMKEVVDNLNHHLNNNHNTVPEFVKKFEKLYINDSLQMQKSVSGQSRAIKQAKDAVVSVVKSEAHGMHESILAKMEDQHVTTKEEMIKMRESQEKLAEAFDKVLFTLKYDKPGKKNRSDKMVKECAVLWHLKTPKEWNEKDVAEALKDYERMSDEQDIKIKFVREGSLIILTTVPYGILHDKAKYEHAIKMFLTRMMDVCNINTEKACRVKATLHLLERDEVCIHPMYSLCEDKGTQMSISQEDKCFQVNSPCYCKCCELELRNEQESKIIFNESYEGDQYFPRYLNGQRKSQNVLYPKDEMFRHSISSSLDFAPIFGDGPSKSEPNIYRHASENKILVRTHSACSIRSFDSSYGSRKSSYAGSLASGYLVRRRSSKQAISSPYDHISSTDGEHPSTGRPSVGSHLPSKRATSVFQQTSIDRIFYPVGEHPSTDRPSHLPSTIPIRQQQVSEERKREEKAEAKKLSRKRRKNLSEERKREEKAEAKKLSGKRRKNLSEESRCSIQ